jgi:hypothetical protein
MARPEPSAIAEAILGPSRKAETEEPVEAVEENDSAEDAALGAAADQILAGDRDGIIDALRALLTLR